MCFTFTKLLNCCCVLQRRACEFDYEVMVVLVKMMVLMKMILEEI